jgi:hypothetical protein
MSPAEASAIELEEPDWRERFEEHCLRWPKLPRYLAEDNAFEATLSDWRRFHFTWVTVQIKGEPVQKHKPASAPDGIIALAKLRVFPPRNLIKDVPRGEPGGYQADDHMWLSIAGEQWRITAIEDKMLMLERGFEDKPAQMQINLATAKWGKYIEAACAVLAAIAPQECHDLGGSSPT